MPSNPSAVPALYSTPRLTTLIASLIVALAAGTNYVSWSYAPQLGSRLRITHTQLNMVGLAGNIGVYASGPIWGRIVDRRGPRILLACGFMFLLGGYSGIRHLYDEGIPDDAASLSTLGLFMTGAGGNGGLTSAVNSTAKTFPDRTRGSTTGLVISGFGLSAFLFSTISHLFYAGNTSSFLFLLSMGTAFPMIMGFFLVRPIPLPPSKHTDIEEPRDAAISSGLEGLPNVYGKRLWKSADFWLLFSILSILSGTGLMYINNVGSMSQALYGYNNPHYDEAKASQWQSKQVSSISLMNFTGRIFIGLVSDLGKNHFGMPRSYSLALVSFFFFISQVATASINDIQNLWIASSLLGLAHGSVFSLFPTVCLEWFGMPHFSENWGYLSLSPMAAGNLFSLVFGRNLDAHEASPSQCGQGLECYVATIYLTIGATFLSILLSLWAGWRDWRKIRGVVGHKPYSARGAGVDGRHRLGEDGQEVL
ncbi:uncharacterized protein LACBIDRAFT_192361 [Laccaria bicolor S238N-H82]|uniref:Predicted protein n=1 Tax=Laccaria bicolor (strain S238N-H82 / ATCC MYA-4686) TaxID=486041 RepID=B0DVE6_LACBS|nr:uncharacterized protein LACBIDRAFT_254577 [Laccaria bicolor S238N-H82]XP_001890585.1 uncharacterized protein LACBIDRAFT_192361 [Laccaria bicolor S238N-H82]EDQ98764.1 predicted protein [Laccaria bicolor S238N-H82]EDR01562.1 predicted protein [Laccaria bicolor S238N-H82]|eukprot:XP_001887914.1 predicted protein [Laccaria bicolor S238N-H82]